MIDYYKILEITPSASTDEITQSYKRLADNYYSKGSSPNNLSEDKFKEIQEAFKILSDPKEREEYDYWYSKRINKILNSDHQNSMSYLNQANKTPRGLLYLLKEVRRKLAGLSVEEIDKPALFNNINKILTDENIALLIKFKEKQINNEIISLVLQLCKALPYPYIKVLTSKILKLAGSDDNTIIVINRTSKKLKYLNYWNNYKGVAAIAIIILTFLVISNLDNDNTSREYNRPENGDLNPTFVNNKVSPEISAEELLLKEKNKLIAEGWEEKTVVDGQLPDCYNFLPKKGKLDNYLEVNVGGGTDVAIKVMNIKSEKCVRYVFINSGSSYKIKNIPEGTYYLKIAYGKDWLSKAENGQCTGKFIRNPQYEKGEDILDFNRKRTDEGYKIPSYQLKLDVLATDITNTFESEKISESEFNK
jgi:hypothetical protein